MRKDRRGQFGRQIPCPRMVSDVEKNNGTYALDTAHQILNDTKLRDSELNIVNPAEYLYTRAGNSHLPSGVLKDEHLSPLTKWTQGEIFKHQNPENCHNSRFLVTEGWSGGLGSEMHVMGSHLAYAMQNNYVLLWGNDSCHRFVDKDNCTRGCACIYRELSRCSTDPSFQLNLKQWEAVNHWDFRWIIPDVFQNAMRLKYPSITADEMRYWWRGQSVGFLMRFNDVTVSEVSSMRMEKGLNYMTGGGSAPFPLPPGVVNAHIRHGDKHMEMALVPSENYVKAFTSMIQNMPNSFSRVLFVSTDDEKAIETCKQLTENMKMTFIYTRLSRMEGGHDVSTWDNTQAGRQRRLVIGHLLQLLMALEADAWIGTRGSNINRLIDELRCVWVDKCKNTYVEVGGTYDGTYDW